MTPVVLALFPERKKMADVVEIEALSFIKQEITRRLILVSQKQNRSPLCASVIDLVINQFSIFALVRNQCFCAMVVRLAMNVHLSQH